MTCGQNGVGLASWGAWAATLPPPAPNPDFLSVTQGLEGTANYLVRKPGRSTTSSRCRLQDVYTHGKGDTSFLRILLPTKMRRSSIGRLEGLRLILFLCHCYYHCTPHATLRVPQQPQSAQRATIWTLKQPKHLFTNEYVDTTRTPCEGITTVPSARGFNILVPLVCFAV